MYHITDSLLSLLGRCCGLLTAFFHGEIKFSAASVHLLVSLGLHVSPLDPLRTNGEAPEGGADTDCDGSPLPADGPEVRAVPTGVARVLPFIRILFQPRGQTTALPLLLLTDYCLEVEGR